MDGIQTLQASNRPNLWKPSSILYTSIAAPAVVALAVVVLQDTDACTSMSAGELVRQDRTGRPHPAETVEKTPVHPIRGNNRDDSMRLRKQISMTIDLTGKWKEYIGPQLQEIP